VTLASDGSAANTDPVCLANTVEVEAARPNILFDPAQLARSVGPDGKPEATALWIDRVGAIIVAWMRRFVDLGRVIEVRAIKACVGSSSYTFPHTEVGFWDYDHLREMAETVLRRYDRTYHPRNQAQAIYFTINPLIPEIQARCANRFTVAPRKDNETGEDGISAKDEQRRKQERRAEYLAQNTRPQYRPATVDDLGPCAAGGDGGTFEPRFRFIPSSEFATADYRRRWRIKRVLVAGHPGLWGGLKKTLKTSIMV